MSRTEQTEIERKYDVDQTAVVPDLGGVAGGGLVVGRTEPRPAVELVATYWDTDDHALVAARTTLRRREGGGDEGWHLKLPPQAGTTGRREVHWPLGSADEPVPADLLALVAGVLDGRSVRPVLRLATNRSVLMLLADDDSALAEVADDVVTATRLASGAERRWREWEVELAPGVDGEPGEGLLDAVEQRVLAAGAVVSSSRSKLARGLGAEG
ncbi:CYTH domain-containing protein [Frigoribacterium sp. CFBP9039]|uniref:CYTH domain-containing protein n=1 Tax=unclassified Frigoribacterium TaxID=2627005 RepID=UPI00177BA670|nr:MULTISPECIES: CYTH domain-containing protein [unclassified Frigoribacterium]MBD8703254.1 CYTH domain-containing protein [Frigoribacterium sp. CFBP 13712]MDY0946474.1 CYTH domain-containing protein [Frigoribacterium sp. CFBP9039]